MKAKAKGFTFIELIAAMAMVSIIMLAINGVFASGVYSYIDGQNKEKAVNSNKIAMSLLSMEIKNSQMFSIGASGYTIKDSVTGIAKAFKKLADVTDEGDLVPIVYIQGNAYSRYMYVLKKVGDKVKIDNANTADSSKDCFELHKYTFTEQPRNKYIPADSAGNSTHTLITLQLTQPELDAYVADTDNIFLAVDLTNIIEANGSTLLSDYDIASFKLVFEPLGQNCYLLAQKSGHSVNAPHYKIKMVAKPETEFTYVQTNDITVCKNIESITLENLGYECKINIKSVAKYHEEELNTSTTILNYRGVS